jgi:hypothetical protein
MICRAYTIEGRQGVGVATVERRNPPLDYLTRLQAPAPAFQATWVNVYAI